jgi:tRNA 2-thiouridine synthesizing protein A
MCWQLRETGDRVQIAERIAQQVVFLIEKANGSIGEVNASARDGPRSG